MIIVGIVCTLAGFWFGFIFCASLKKKGYEVESKNINTVSITPPQDGQSKKEQTEAVEFLPADIATMYSDIGSTKVLEDVLKDIFKKIKSLSERGCYSADIGHGIYKNVDPEMLINALYDMGYTVKTSTGDPDRKIVVTSMECFHTFTIQWGEKSLPEEKSLLEEKSLCEEQVNVVQDSCAETGSHSSESDKEINVFYETFETLRQESS